MIWACAISSSLALPLADGLGQRLVFQDLLGLSAAPWWAKLAWDLAIIAGVFGGMLSAIAMFCIWWERKVAGHMQSRLGPNRVGPIGILQSVADGLKLMLKEDLLPRDADKWMFRFAPYMAFAPVFAAYMVLPFGPEFVFERRLAVGVFYILAVLSVEIMGVIMAGWASNNKWAIYGAMREACQMVSYEIPLGISIIVAVMAAGTLNMVDLGNLQGGGIHTWLIFRNPFTFAAFFAYFVASLASNKRAPFDLPESESELVAGFHTEYSGLRFSFFFFAEYAAMFVVGGIQATLFLGAWNDPFGIIGYFHAKFADNHHDLQLLVLNAVASGIFVTKAMAIIFAQMWLRWTLPRPRIDQVLYACVKVLLPLSCCLLLGASLWGLLVGSRPGVPWVDYQPFSWSDWQMAPVALATQIILTLIGLAGLTGIVLWVGYAAVTGRNLKQRLTDPADIIPRAA